MKAHADAAKQLGALLLMALLAGCGSAPVTDADVTNASAGRDRCAKVCAAIGCPVAWFSSAYVAPGEVYCACAGAPAPGATVKP